MPRFLFVSSQFTAPRRAGAINGPRATGVCVAAAAAFPKAAPLFVCFSGSALFWMFNSYCYILFNYLIYAALYCVRRETAFQCQHLLFICQNDGLCLGWSITAFNLFQPPPHPHAPMAPQWLHYFKLHTLFRPRELYLNKASGLKVWSVSELIWRVEYFRHKNKQRFRSGRYYNIMLLDLQQRAEPLIQVL